MAYLTERATTKEPITSTNLATATPANEGACVVAEHTNTEISRFLKTKKTELIGLLSQFPATALWILLTHQQSDTADTSDDEAVLKSDLANALNEIKKYYAISEATFNEASVAEQHSQAKQQLAEALQEFPYSFDDLKNMVEVLLHHFQNSNSYSKGSNKLIDKRLFDKEKSPKRKHNPLVYFFDYIALEDLNQSFLFLPMDALMALLPELLETEATWLKTRQKLASANVKLVLFIANQYKASFLDFDDLVQEGQSGLLKAVDRFDHRLGFQFSTYAGYWIRQAISRSLSRSERVVRIPCGQVATINKVYRAKEELIGKTGKDPSTKQLAEHIDMSYDEVSNLLSISQTAMSLEADEDEENAFAPIDYLEQQIFTHAFKSIAKNNLEQLLGDALNTLTAREAKVIYSHFGLSGEKEMTLQEIGTELNLTRERIRQIQVTALSKIKQNFGEQLVCFL